MWKMAGHILFTLIATLLVVSGIQGKHFGYSNALDDCPPNNTPGKDVFFPAEDCEHYYQCDHGKPVLRPCPPGQEWSQELERCELPEVAQCSVGTTSTSTSTSTSYETLPPNTSTTTDEPTSEKPGPSGCPPYNTPGKDVFLPAEDCQHFYKCDHGKPVLIPCPPGQEWSQALERCEWPEVAQCSVGTTSKTSTTKTSTPKAPTPTTSTTPTTTKPGSSGCPPYNTPGKDVFLPAEDCQHFYKCDHGKPVLIPCPAGQEWSQALERCEWPEVAQCSVGTNPTTTTPTTPTPTTSTTSKPTTPTTTKPGPSGCPPYNTPGKDVFLPGEDCQHFYKCDHGKPVLIPCPAGQEWSQALERCEWPETAQCSITSSPHNPTPTVTSTTPKPEPSGCPPYNTPGKDAFLPAEDCQHFYKCDHGKPVLIPCPPGQEWSQVLERCEWPEVAQCSVGSAPTTSTPTEPTPTTSTTSKPTTPTTTKPGPSGCPPYNTPGKDVFLPAEDCQHFYKCDHGKPVLIPCPAGQDWSQALERCEWPETAQCSVTSNPHNPTPTVTSTTPKPGPSGCPPYNTPGKDAFLPAEDCQHFYKCDHGKPVLIPCPPGQEWSQVLERCEWPEVAQCSVGSNPTTSTPTTSTPSTPTPTSSTTPKPTTPTTTKPGPSGCPPYNTPGKDVFLPAEDCQHFYKCDNGKPVLIPCPAGQEWSPTLERCEWPETAQCSVTSYPETSTPTPQPPTSKPVQKTCPVHNGIFEDMFPAEDCHHFYKCDNGKPVLMSCPITTEWSQAAQRCEWPAIARCSTNRES
ncbi:flocculation protein FLO11-like [Chrysoperla carnea]|uniref:flocculation protein FLO11-like n=1 Tax=Chrysoperla carnea TaxID=189513 RepID=UPI001D08952C|nr:flocculation protein FLO11-like [Chrysoperla carnea]